ncbi:hypothetical protein LEP1GSC130_0004 [Leptospira santarosai str. 200403458]|nr:hypothetical protein LEP1GSC130_0004 [Leptospira santarosai str. 200403458]
MAINIQKEFNKKTFMGVAIGIAAVNGLPPRPEFCPGITGYKKEISSDRGSDFGRDILRGPYQTKGI